MTSWFQRLMSSHNFSISLISKLSSIHFSGDSHGFPSCLQRDVGRKPCLPAHAHWTSMETPQSSHLKKKHPSFLVGSTCTSIYIYIYVYVYVYVCVYNIYIYNSYITILNTSYTCLCVYMSSISPHVFPPKKKKKKKKKKKTISPWKISASRSVRALFVSFPSPRTSSTSLMRRVRSSSQTCQALRRSFSSWAAGSKDQRWAFSWGFIWDFYMGFIGDLWGSMRKPWNLGFYMVLPSKLWGIRF